MTGLDIPHRCHNKYNCSFVCIYCLNLPSEEVEKRLSIYNNNNNFFFPRQIWSFTSTLYKYTNRFKRGLQYHIGNAIKLNQSLYKDDIEHLRKKTGTRLLQHQLMLMIKLCWLWWFLFGIFKIVNWYLIVTTIEWWWWWWCWWWRWWWCWEFLIIL